MSFFHPTGIARLLGVVELQTPTSEDQVLATALRQVNEQLEAEAAKPATVRDMDRIDQLLDAGSALSRKPRNPQPPVVPGRAW